MAKISAYILTYNEENKIEAALKTLEWADEIVVADSFSSDRTVEIAKRYTGRIVQIPFQGFGRLRNDAVAHCSHEWIFSLDADERCTPQAREEILATIRDPDAADAYLVPRRNRFMGRWIRHSGWYPDYRQPQLFRKGKLRYKEDPVHEGYVLDGTLRTLKSEIWQIPFRDLSQSIEKMHRYSTLGAEEAAGEGGPRGDGQGVPPGILGVPPALRLPLGILDGWPGFVIAFAYFEQTFYKYAKLTEMQSAWNEELP